MQPQNFMTLVDAAPKASRIRRYPKHSFITETIPYAISPFCIAPVLPAETLNGFYFESREVSHPVKTSIVGAKSEWWLFYVKLRDLPLRDTIENMFVDPTNANFDGLDTAADVAYNHQTTGRPNWLKECYKRVIETWFRDAGDAWSQALIGAYATAQVKDQGWLDSLRDTTTLPAGAVMGGVASDAESYDKILTAYEYLRSLNLTDMGFRDYLATFGIKDNDENLHRPELVDYWSDWQYPSNTIDPANGTPRSAYSFVSKNNFKQRKFFKEPGFLIGVHVVRPKLYFQRQYSNLASFMDNGYSWLPEILRETHPEASLREFTGGAAGDGPLSNGITGPTNGYWVDMRDLFVHGDQFTNTGSVPTTYNGVSLPNAALNSRYPAFADIDALFVTTNVNKCRADGVISLDISGLQRDMTNQSHHIV
jgi:hypothetical protein